MQPFKVPPWEKGAEVIEFKSVRPSGGAAAAPKKSKKKKPKKPKESKPEAAPKASKFRYRPGCGPLAPPPDSASSSGDEEDDVEPGIRAMHKVRAGRIEKTAAKAAKAGKKQLSLKPELAQAAVEAMETAPASAPSSGASLASKLQAELLGGRFRYLNEQLYSLNAKKAEAVFREDITAFRAYHAGYQQQVEKWPLNPLNRIVKSVKRLPKTAIIGDFGCGEGKLSQSVPNKVYSMDLVAARPDIIACNMTDTPLKDQSLDVAVYCLSLMGTDLNEFLLEANRVLKLHGNVYIAEIQSRFEDVREFVRCLAACGFDLVKKDVAVNYFYFFQFKKMRHVPKTTKLKAFSLKPCLYRKR